MKITKLRIDHFGKLTGLEIDLKDGINLIYGRNESGKSTVHAFIRAMLFGLHRGRGRGAKKDAYSRYEPWENGSFFSGVMEFESGGKIFRLSRNFYKNDKRESLVCVTDGECLSVEQGDLGMLLGGVSEGAFDQTISIGQLHSATDEELDVLLRNYVANYQGSGDGELNVERAIQLLKQKRKVFEQKQKEEDAKHQTQRRQLHARMEYIQMELQGLEDELRKSKFQWEECREVVKTPKAVFPYKKNKDVGEGDRMVALLCFLWTAIIAGTFIWTDLWVLGFCGIMMGLFVLGRTMIYRISVGDGKGQKGQDTKEQETHLRWKVEQLEERIKEKKTEFENLRMDIQEYDLQESRETHTQEEVNSINLAIKRIEEISTNIQKYWKRELHQRITAIMKEITDGHYTGVTVTDHRNIGLYMEGQYVPLEQVSQGTAQQLYFSLRMTAAEYLCQEESLPILLDEAFAMYDDERLEAVLRWLAAHSSQVLLFTCQKREMEIMKRLHLPVHAVTL